MRNLKGICLLAVTLLLIVLGAPAFAQPPLAEWAKADPRLTRKIAFASERIYVADLLAEVSKQTGITFVADERNDAGGTPLAVSLNGLALTEFMDALWSQLSLQFATWNWERTDDNGKMGYRLTRSDSSARFCKQFRAETQEALEKHVASLISGLDMTAEEREILYGADPIAKTVLSEGETVSGLTMFRDTFTPEQRTRILRGEAVRLPVTSLPPTAQNWIANLQGRRQGAKVVRFVTKTDGEVIPSLYITMGPDAPQRLSNGAYVMDSYGGYSYAGGPALEKIWEKKASDKWFFRGDSRTNPAMEGRAISTVSAPQEVDANGLTVLNRWGKRLLHAARGSGISLMALLPRQFNEPIDIEGKKVGEVIEQLCDTHKIFISKWRGNVLLVNYYQWMTKDADAETVPYPLVAKLRRIRYGQEPLDLIDVSALVMKCRPEQRATLSRDFGTARLASEFAPVFDRLRRDPELARRWTVAPGIPVDTEIIGAFRRAAPKNAPPLDFSSASHLLLTVTEPEYDREADGTQLRRYTFSLRDAQGRALVEASASVRPYKETAQDKP